MDYPGAPSKGDLLLVLAGIAPANTLKADYKGIEADIRKQIRRYADEWEGNARFLEESGVYRNIADFAGIGSGEWWLDMGCASGNLIAEMCRHLETTPIGIDVNSYLLRMARDRMAQNGTDVNYHVSYEIVKDRDTGLRLVPKEKEGFSLQEGVPNIVLDDMREPRIIAKHLAGRRLDKMVYSMAGGWTSFGYEFVKRAQFDPFSILIAMNKMIMIRAAEMVREGGELIVVQRVGLVEGHDESEIFGLPDEWPGLEMGEEVTLDYPDERGRIRNTAGTISITSISPEVEDREIGLVLRRYIRT